MQVLLVGNPNCGKTTLFNALTGSNQRVGNWPQVTVEKKTGRCILGDSVVEITDLPGIYSLTAFAMQSQDEQIASRALINLPFDVIINVIDACHLERHLYLTSQILELGKPVILVLNMMDIARQRRIAIDTKALALTLNCPVILLEAHKKIGIAALKEAMRASLSSPKALNLSLSKSLEKALQQVESQLENQGFSAVKASYYAKRLMEGDVSLKDCEAIQPLLSKEADYDILFADARYQAIHNLVVTVEKRNSNTSEHFTAKLDRIVLHRYFALPIFLGVMYLMFLFAINVGGAFQDFFDLGTDALFVQGTAWLLGKAHAPSWLIALLAHGVGKGINTTVTFIPVIAAMFFFLSFLEGSGYMARAAFVVDKLMRFLGLPGKAFVPMIVGFGCNVPAILAARTLDSEQDRLLTVMMSPFMSCSARLAIYAVFVAAFFPQGGQNIVFSLYLLGILMAVLTGFILRKTSLRGQPSPLILELPAYHKPALKRLLRETSLRLRHFLIRATRLIIPVCIILGVLNSLTLQGNIQAGNASADSILSLLAQWVTPLFAPMGLDKANWPATVGLLTGMLAKEVVVGSLNSLYAELGQLANMSTASFDLWLSLKLACGSILHNLSELGHALFNPLAVSAGDSSLDQPIYGMMAQRFDGKAGAYAYLVFVLLYIPCVSTMAVIRQEANKRMMWFSIIWSFILAYFTAVLIYQLATFSAHPQQSLGWSISILGGFAILLCRLRQPFWRGNDVVTNS